MSNFEMAQKNYERGLWTVGMLEKLVEKGKLTTEEFQQIVGQ